MASIRRCGRRVVLWESWGGPILRRFGGGSARPPETLPVLTSQDGGWGCRCREQPSEATVRDIYGQLLLLERHRGAVVRTEDDNCRRQRRIVRLVSSATGASVSATKSGLGVGWRWTGIFFRWPVTSCANPTAPTYLRSTPSFYPRSLHLLYPQVFLHRNLNLDSTRNRSIILDCYHCTSTFPSHTPLFQQRDV